MLYHTSNLSVVVDKTKNMEHPGTSNNYDNYKKNMKKTEETSNLEAAMLKLHKCFHFMILL